MAHFGQKPPSPKSGPRFVTVFRHWRTGKLMVAADYGYKAWPLGATK